jgi:hypothetical protein
MESMGSPKEYMLLARYLLVKMNLTDTSIKEPTCEEGLAAISQPSTTDASHDGTEAWL